MNISVRVVSLPKQLSYNPQEYMQMLGYELFIVQFGGDRKMENVLFKIFQVADWIRTAQKRHSNLWFSQLHTFLTGDVHFCEIQDHGQ